MKTTRHLTIMVMSLAVGWSALAQTPLKSFRANELTPQIWNQYNKGEIQELVIEFQEGDKIPVTLQAEGDLIVTAEANPSYVTVQRNFWVQLKHHDILMSLDGTHFKPFKKLVSGTLEVGAGSETQGGVANSINVGFKAFLK